MLITDIRDYLSANGYGTTDWPIYCSFFPDDQDQMIGIFETGGFPADTLGRENERLTFQVRVRAGRLDYASCFNAWKDLFDLLQDASETGGYLVGYTYIQAMHYGPLVFNDDRGRTNMTANFKVLKARG